LADRLAGMAPPATVGPGPTPTHPAIPSGRGHEAPRQARARRAWTCCCGSGRRRSVSSLVERFYRGLRRPPWPPALVEGALVDLLLAMIEGVLAEGGAEGSSALRANHLSAARSGAGRR
jgi:hypothetical protein